MRKSAAPSVLRQKKSQFTSPFAKPENHLISNKEADHIPKVQSPYIAGTDGCKRSPGFLTDIPKSNETKKTSSDIELSSKAKKFKSEDDKTVSSPSSPNLSKSNDSPIENQKDISLTSNEILEMNNLDEKVKVAPLQPQFYNVVWCKRSAKKHKKWEGDAILIIKGCTATLKEMGGKEIAKGLGYKIKEVTGLTEGSKFFIGGKECEILSAASEKDCGDIKLPTEPEKPKKHVPVFPSSTKKFHSPIIGHLRTKAPPSIENKPRDPGAIYMPMPSFTHQ